MDETRGWHVDRRSGFASVDKEGSPEFWIAYLDAVRSTPSWRQAKRDSIERLGLGPGERGLDVGCGTGEEVAAMGELVGVSGCAVGVDLSTVMVSEGRRRHVGRGHSGGFCVADAGRLPFADGSFQACRVERTLQHCDDPYAVVVEMARLLVPGGRLVALEPDWDTLVFDTPKADVNRRIYRDVLDRRPSRTVGRRLRATLSGAGLGDIDVQGWAVCFADYDDAERSLTLQALTEASVRAGVVSDHDAASWLDSLRRASDRGTFFASVTMFTAVGTKLDL